MRIAINCRSFLKKQYTGIGRYAYHLVKSLTAIDRQSEYLLYARIKPFSFGKKIPCFPAKNFITKVDRFNRGIAKTLKNVDICHFPSPGPMEAPDGAEIIVTVHDVIFKAFASGHTQSTIDAGEKQFDQIREKAAKIICCSQNTLDDVKKYFRIPQEKLELVYQGVDKEMFFRISDAEESDAMRVLAEKGIIEPFILSVGTIEPRKNLINTIHAFHILKKEKGFPGLLVVIGMQGWLHEDLRALIENLQLEKCVKFLGYLPDEELRYFYNKAEVFVFPSFYEGFGFPIVEAFCCGVPVVTSNVSSCPEVAGDAALTVDPNSPGEIAGAVDRIISDADLRGSLIEKGLQRAKGFDFLRTAEETLRIYKKVYEKKNGGA